MLDDFMAAYQSGKNLYELIKATKELSNSHEVLMAVSEVQQKLMDANASALASQEREAALAAEVRELKTLLRDSEDWQKEKNRYQIFQFPETKALAYKLREDMANGEPIHYLCVTCMDKKKRTTLQPSQYYLTCPECDISIRPQKHSPVPVNTRRALSYGVKM